MFGGVAAVIFGLVCVGAFGSGLGSDIKSRNHSLQNGYDKYVDMFGHTRWAKTGRRFTIQDAENETKRYHRGMGNQWLELMYKWYLEFKNSNSYNGWSFEEYVIATVEVKGIAPYYAFCLLAKKFTPQRIVDLRTEAIKCGLLDKEYFRIYIISPNDLDI